MAIDITMPALSPTMEEGTLATWHVKVGDVIKSGDVMCEIETDKVTFYVECEDKNTREKKTKTLAMLFSLLCADLKESRLWSLFPFRRRAFSPRSLPKPAIT